MSCAEPGHLYGLAAACCRSVKEVRGGPKYDAIAVYRALVAPVEPVIAIAVPAVVALGCTVLLHDVRVVSGFETAVPVIPIGSQCGDWLQ
ncbi:MAG: hypothetical protein JO091_04895 [Acidobacteriaceae bacterium]|nr:hypothetical protein [Acidobacteriaceae bacterium]